MVNVCVEYLEILHNNNYACIILKGHRGPVSCGVSHCMGMSLTVVVKFPCSNLILVRLHWTFQLGFSPTISVKSRIGALEAAHRQQQLMENYHSPTTIKTHFSGNHLSAVLIFEFITQVSRGNTRLLANELGVWIYNIQEYMFIF